VDVESANYTYEETDDIIVAPSIDELRQDWSDRCSYTAWHYISEADAPTAEATAAGHHQSPYHVHPYRSGLERHYDNNHAFGQAIS
jgi:hypothetical protein